MQLGSADRHHLSRFAFEPRAQLGLADERRPELLMVLLSHPGKEVKVVGVPRCHATGRRGCEHSVPQQGGGRERVRATAGLAGRKEPVDPKGVRDRGDIGRAISNRAARMAGTAGVAGARVGDVAPTTFRAEGHQRREQQSSARGYRSEWALLDSPNGAVLAFRG